MPLEDLPMLVLSLAPFVFLLVWLLRPSSKPRIILLVISLVLFIVLLPYTTLYLALIVGLLFPGAATSGIGNAAPSILFIGVIMIVISVGTLMFRWHKRKLNRKS